MEQKTFSFVDEINSEKDSWTLRVRLIRMWKQDYQTDLILLDEKLNKIHATVRKAIFPLFDKMLNEGDPIIISRFGVAANNGKYPIIRHEFKLNFYRNTSVKRCEDFQGPLHGFVFLSFADILNGSFDSDGTFDVIGNVVKCGDMEIFDRDGRETKRITLEIEDVEEKRVGCTLWNEYAQQMKDFIDDGIKDVNVSIIIQICKIRYWKGDPVVNNCMFASRLFINQDLHEIHEFKNRLIMKNPDDSTSQLGTHLSSQTVFFDRDEFLNKHDLKSVDELLDLKQEMLCIVFGTIKRIQEKYGWFYASCCKCKKKVLPRWEVDMDDVDNDAADADDNQVLYCPKCKKKPASIIPRYKLTVRVQDDTGTVSFTLFDAEVQKFVKKTALQLREKQLANQDDGSFPEELNELLNKKVVSKVSVSSYNIQNHSNVFTVVKASVDEEIIARMEHSKSTVSVTDPFDAVRLEESSQGYFDSKDAMSYTADSSAIVELDNSTTSPMMKRLKSSEVNEDLLQGSSTRKQLLPVKIEKA